MKLTGMVDVRTLEKYEREAKEKNRETWYLSWCMDTNQEGMRDLFIAAVFSRRCIVHVSLATNNLV